MEQQKQENNQIGQLTQQVEQLQQQLEQASKQLKQAESKVESLNQAKIELEKQRLIMEDKIERYKAQTDRNYKSKMAEQAEARTQIEKAQLIDRNPYNDKIRQIGS